MNLFLLARQNWLTLATNILFAIFIITLPGYTGAAKVAYYFMALTSLWYVVRNYKELKLDDPVLKLFFVVIVLNIVWTIITFYLNGSPGKGSNLIWSRHIHLLFLVPLYFLFRRVKLPFYVVWSSVVISVLLGLYVGYQDVQIGDQRARGGMHPILFGSIILCESMYLLVITFIRREIWIKAISFGVFGAGILLVIWTQSRGVWVAFPLLLLIVGGSVLKKQSVGVRWLVTLIIAGVAVVASQHPSIEAQISRTINNISDYQASTDVTDVIRGSSIGTRFEMWKAGWQMFLENPLIGVGVGGYDLVAKANATRYGVSGSAYFFYHPHNQYISALSTRGFLGLVLLVFILIIPVYLLRNKARKINLEQDAILMILIITVAYTVYGLSDVPFEGKSTVMFFAVFMALFLASADKKPVKLT